MEPELALDRPPAAPHPLRDDPARIVVASWGIGVLCALRLVAGGPALGPIDALLAAMVTAFVVTVEGARRGRVGDGGRSRRHESEITP